MSEPRAIYRIGTRRQLPSGEEAGFPGCRAQPMNAAQLARMEDKRIEYWDAEDGLAWMVREAPGTVHERPAHRLAALLDRIAEARGAAIDCCGATTFYERGPDGEHIRAMEADQTVYMDAAQGQAVGVPAVALGDDPPPDVVLEVDHTTDVRRRKLREYERWRFPEVWVEVPEVRHRSRSRRRSGLKIHLLDAKSNRYGEAEASRALPGWRADEIHRALNEPVRSAGTWAAISRVGRALARQEGLQRAEETALRGLLEAQEAAAMVRQILAHRGIACSPGFLADADIHRLAAHTPVRLVDAAFACRSEADFPAALAAAKDH